MIILAIAALLAAEPLVVGQCASERASLLERTAVTAAATGGGTLTAEMLNRLKGHLRACEGGGEVQRSSLLAAIALIMSGDLRQTIGSKGIDVAILDRCFDGQSETVKTDKEITSAEGDETVRALIAAGVPAETLNANAGLVGQYFGARIMVERVRRGLP